MDRRFPGSLSALVLAFVTAIAPLSAGGISIETFDGAQSSVTDTVTPTARSSSVGALSLGGSRSVEVSFQGGDVGLLVSARTSSGLFVHSQDSGTVGTTRITWDGDTDPNTFRTTGLGGINFVVDGSTAIILKDLYGDQNFCLSIRIFDSRDPSTVGYLESTKSVPRLVAGDVVLPLSAFVPVGIVASDLLQHVGAVQLLLNHGCGAAVEDLDIRLSAVLTDGRCPQTPLLPGQQVVDSCGICDGGDRDRDQCGVCFGGGADVDQCGVCFGDNAAKDRCGVCFGDGNSCVSCTTQDLTAQITSMREKSKEQRLNALFFIERIRRVDRVSASRARKQIEAAYKQLTAQIEKLPLQVQQCNELCAKSDLNADLIKSYQSYVVTLKDISLKLLTIRTSTGGGRCRGTAQECAARQRQDSRSRNTFKGLARQLARENVVLSNGLPKSFSVCG